jgi:tetratricopeptide (TPR) repeat protein
MRARALLTAIAVGLFVGLLPWTAVGQASQREADEAARQRARGLLAGELEAGNYPALLRMLAASFEGSSTLRVRDAAEILIEASAEQLARLEDAAPAQDLTAEPKRFLSALRARAEGRWAAAFAAWSELLRTRAAWFVAVDRGGRDALRRARAGDDSGLPLLEQTRAQQPEALWAISNLGLGQRLLGRYEAAMESYRKALELGGRRAGILNELALVHLAREDEESAERLLREGSADTKDPAGRGTAQGNLARVLMRRADRLPASQISKARELRREALVMLRAALEQDPSRTRSRYWMERLLKGLPKGT